MCLGGGRSNGARKKSVEELLAKEKDPCNSKEYIQDPIPSNAHLAHTLVLTRSIMIIFIIQDWQADAW